MTLYTFNSSACQRRPGDGPLVVPHFAVTREGNESNVIALGKDWIKYLKRINGKKAYNKLVAVDYGPSKGFNKQGKLKFNMLCYPGNPVNILRVEIGVDGHEWGLLDTLPLDLIPGAGITRERFPWYFHEVYGWHNDEPSKLKNAPIVPIIGKNRWIPMRWLTKAI